MKKFKSILALTASVLALSAFAAPVSAFADDIDITSPNTTGDTTLTLENASTYTVTIPASVTFTGVEQAVTADVTASGILLGNGKAVKVGVASTKGYQLTTGTSGDNSYIGYTPTVAKKDSNSTGETLIASPVFSGTDKVDFVYFLNGTAATKGSGSVTFTFTPDGGAHASAGTYTDTLTFTVDATATAPIGG